MSYVKILEDIYSGSTGAIVLHKESNKIPIKNGVTHAYTISTVVFTACFQEVFTVSDWEQLGIRFNGEYLSNLRFAYDIALSNSGGELQRLIHDLERKSRLVGVKINTQKTKIMFSSLDREQRFAIGSEAMGVVKEYSCLGQVMKADSKHELK